MALLLARQARRSALARLRNLAHVHYDPLERLVGGYRYEICSCGARRVREVLLGTGVPMLPGWDQVLTSRTPPHWISATDPAVELVQSHEGQGDFWYGRR